MGVTNAFAKANALMAEELGFQLDPEGDNLQFRQRLYLTGWARFEHCVKLCKMWAGPRTTGKQKYARLIDLMKMVTPSKQDSGTKYRNPQAQAAIEQGRAMDQQAIDAAARERCGEHRTRNCMICEQVDLSRLPV